MDRRPSSPPPREPLGIGVGLLFVGAGVAGVVWAGAQLAARLGRGAWLDAGLAPALHALLRLPSHLRDPKMAWPAELRAALPGATLYWACTLSVLVITLVVLIFAYRIWPHSGVGVERRERLGVDTAARLATTRDVAPLVVSRPEEGRFILGRVGRRLVATEVRRPARTRRRGLREDDRSAVCVIGPTRCGKTANTVSGILEWEGPAILSSVKTDLLEATFQRRNELGDVKVFDPTGATRWDAARRSPWFAPNSRSFTTSRRSRTCRPSSSTECSRISERLASNTGR